MRCPLRLLFSEFLLCIRFFHSEMCEQKCCFSGANWTSNNYHYPFAIDYHSFGGFFPSVCSIAMHQIKLRIQSIDSWISFVCSIKFLNHSNKFIHTRQNLFRNRGHLMGWKRIRGRSTHNWQYKSNENKNNNNKNQNKTNKKRMSMFNQKDHRHKYTRKCRKVIKKGLQRRRTHFYIIINGEMRLSMGKICALTAKTMP